MQIINEERFDRIFQGSEELDKFIYEMGKYDMDYIETVFHSAALMRVVSSGINSVTGIPGIPRQVLSKFGIINPEVDPYIKMCELLKNLSFLSGNCCEIGAGEYPRLAELIAPELERNHHKLTIYDPSTVPDKLSKGVTIVKEKFTKKTDLKGIDTLVSLFPCEVACTIIDKALDEDKNLLLAFCGCDHSTLEHQKWLGEYWAEDVCMDYREQYGKEIEIMQWPKQYGIPYPIMVRRQKVKK